MLKRIFELLMIGALAACTSEKSGTSGDTRVAFSMATVGVENFTDYIRSLDIYAFQRKASGEFVFYKTLANFDAAGVAALEDVSGRGNAKYYNTNLPIGIYELYFVGNVSGGLEGNLQAGLTLPGDMLLRADRSGEKEVYFIGKLSLTVVADQTSPASVILSRVVSKLVVVLDGVPAQVDSIRLTVGNIAANYSLEGVVPGQSITVERTFAHVSSAGVARDTLVCEMLMFPSVGDSSPFSITFRAVNGQEKTKEMPSLKMLPDKYVRVTGTIDDSPGALLSFDLNVRLFVFDSWRDEDLPDFSVKPSV